MPTSVRSLLRGCPTPLALVSVEGGTAATNPAWDERVGEGSIEARLHEDDRAPFAAARDAVLAGESSRTVDVRLAKPGAASRVRLTLWPADERSAWVAAEPARDEDEERKAKILTDCFQVMDATRWSCDRTGKILVSDGNALAHLGLAPGQMVGMNMFEVFPEGSPACALVHRTLAGESFWYEDITEQAHWLNVYTPLRDASGEAVGVQAMSVNFGKDLALAKQSKSLAECVERLPIAVAAFDKQGVCTLLTGALLDTIGLVPENVVGKSLFEIFPDRKEVLADLRRALDGEEHVGELAWGERQLRTRYVPLKGPFGEIIGACTASEDATEQLRAEHRLREQLELIESQKRAIAELGTPIIEVFEDVLAVPVVGMIDEPRAEQMMGALLEAIVGRQARFAILDITGVKTVDAATASHLVKVITASRLLGCEGMITGIRPSVSSTFVEIGADLSQIRTLRSLKDALRFCESALRDDAAALGPTDRRPKPRGQAEGAPSRAQGSTRRS